MNKCKPSPISIYFDLVEIIQVDYLNLFGIVFNNKLTLKKNVYELL